MPLYEYQCPACDKRFEQLKSLAQREEAQPCIACGAVSQRRLSGFAIGSGRGSSPPVESCQAVGSSPACSGCERAQG